ncbi:802_t:CDS:2 [Racocetra fulgida]|uniref:802_t:CDS:1 n=1 Tax=Racocetra fulgida TaxID=60492 RepID=A0A9N8YTI8_9GLOM|nr:802_t:CDS:2 [Racocetra fulgida]
MASKNNVIEEIQELIQKIKNEYKEGVDFEFVAEKENYQKGNKEENWFTYRTNKDTTKYGDYDLILFSKFKLSTSPEKPENCAVCDKLTFKENGRMKLFDGEKDIGGPSPNVVGYFHPECAKKYFTNKEQPNVNNARIKEKLLRNLDINMFRPHGRFGECGSLTDPDESIDKKKLLAEIETILKNSDFPVIDNSPNKSNSTSTETEKRGGGEKWFHSKKCKEIFEKVIRNRKLIDEAYTFLTGNAGKGNQNPGGGGGQTPDQPELEVCDRCGKKYDFSQKFPKFKKKEEENENYWFCSKKCYDCFNVCDNCGKIERLKENELRMTKGKVFCSSNCRQKLEKNPGKFDPDSLPNCDQCGEKFRLDEKGFYTIYSFTGREEKFCSPKCRTDETQQTNRPTSENGEEEGNDSDLDDHSESNSDNSSDSNSDQDGKSNNNLPKNIQEIAHLPLLQAQARARQEIEKLLKDNDISDHELNQED